MYVILLFSVEVHKPEWRTFTPPPPPPINPRGSAIQLTETLLLLGLSCSCGPSPYPLLLCPSLLMSTCTSSARLITPASMSEEIYDHLSSCSLYVRLFYAPHLIPSLLTSPACANTRIRPPNTACRVAHSTHPSLGTVQTTAIVTHTLAEQNPPSLPLSPLPGDPSAL